MSCAELEPELIGYHFGTCAPEVREQLEQHLPGCPGCVKSLLLLKRQLETQPEVPSPSPAARERLRQAVAREVGVAPWRWWERPLALASAAAAAVLAVFITWSVATGRVEVLIPPPELATAADSGGLRPGAVVDASSACCAAGGAVAVGALGALGERADQGRVRGRALHPERLRR